MTVIIGIVMVLLAAWIGYANQSWFLGIVLEFALIGWMFFSIKPNRSKKRVNETRTKRL